MQRREQEELDELEATIVMGLEHAVREGHAEHAGVDPAGKQLYRLTPAGTAHVEGLLPPELVSRIKHEAVAVAARDLHPRFHHPSPEAEYMDTRKNDQTTERIPMQEDPNRTANAGERQGIAGGTNDAATRGGSLLGSDREVDMAQHVGLEFGTRRLPLNLPPHFALGESVTLYYDAEHNSADSGDGIGLEFPGESVTWLPKEEAIACARGILARLEPTALVPRVLHMGRFPADASREELVASAASVIGEDDRSYSMRKQYAEGILDGLNGTLEQLGYRVAALGEIVDPTGTTNTGGTR